MSTSLAVIILAAGEGTRMRSATPKVLHGFAGRTMLGHTLAATAELDAQHTLVVVGHGRDAVTARLTEIAPKAVPVVQAEQHGTGHAVGLALGALPDEFRGTVVVVPGDVPLLTPATLARLVAAHNGIATHGDAAATVLTSVVDDPTGYGRVLRRSADAGAPSGTVERIVEHADADAAERAVTEIATGVYAFDQAALRGALTQVDTDNAQGEQYLPDVVAILVAAGAEVRALTAPAAETAGVNDRVQLSAAGRAYNQRLLEAHMRAGVTVIDPATTWVDAGVSVEADATLLPSTDLHGATHIAAGARVGPHTSLTDTTVGAGAVLDRVVAAGARIGAGVTIGPYAYLRPGTVLADQVHIGTYVEVKNAVVGTGTKVPHLSYVGDADIGEHTNIGAATVFVNYDGVAKHRSVVGSHARTGADNMFVAPVRIGDGAYTAAGAVINKDVPPGALARSSARQQNVEGWVAERRAGTPADEAGRRAEQTAHTDQPNSA